MYKYVLIFISALFLFSCSQKIIYQVDGYPVIDNIIRVELVKTDIILKYMALEYFYEYEGDEKYKSFNFLNIMDDNIINISNNSSLEMKIYIFNPQKDNYKIKTVYMIGNNKNVIHHYNGRLSRNDLVISLPIIKGEIIQIYFEVLNYNDEMQYRSFTIKYLI